MGNRASNVIRASSVSETSTAQKHVRREMLLETVTYTYILVIFFYPSSRRAVAFLVGGVAFKFAPYDYVIP